MRRNCGSGRHGKLMAELEAGLLVGTVRSVVVEKSSVDLV